jgi:pilus assembly protein CpaF
MLGRRRSRSAPNTIDIADRIRRRAVNAAAPPERMPANSDGRLARRTAAATGGDKPGKLPAKVLRFTDTPIYHVHGKLAVTPSELYQVLAVMADRLEVRLDGPAVSRSELAGQVVELIGEILGELQLRLNLQEQRQLVGRLLAELVGFGPLELLLADPTVTDIMVNGVDKVYVERRGRLQPTDVGFRNEVHLMRIARRMVRRVGRRIDESRPMVNARLADGSRVNVIIPPLAVDGPEITIRKHSCTPITLDRMARQENLSYEMATVLRVATRCRLNVVISGGTGCGKTTLLNAMSETIGPDERVVTIEDAADLQLQQPHVVRLETRPFNLEGDGEICQRDLLRNALRMRPDRIIIGEVRGAEVAEMLHAMNSGHEGSLTTVHARGPREALTRLSTMACLSGFDVPHHSIQAQLGQSIDLIVHLERMRDGRRRVTRIVEVLGFEDNTIITQDLFSFEFSGEDESGRLTGRFAASGVRPSFVARAGHYGLEDTLMAAF